MTNRYMMLRFEDLAPPNSGYNVVYNPIRYSKIADLRNDHALYDMHNRIAFNGELSRNTEVAYHPNVPWNGNIYDIKPVRVSNKMKKMKKMKKRKKVRFSKS